MNEFRCSKNFKFVSSEVGSQMPKQKTVEIDEERKNL